MTKRIKNIAINPGIIGGAARPVSSDLGIGSAIQLHQNIADERFMTCIHEAGHAVASHLLDFRLHWVSIDSDFIQNDAIAIEHECAAANTALTMSVSSHLLKPILERGRTTSTHEKMIIENYGVMVLAGPVAERRKFLEKFDPEGSYGDYRQLMTMANRLFKGAKRAMFIARVENASRRFVDENWLAIAHVAHALFHRKTLTASDVADIVASVKQPIAA